MTPTRRALILGYALLAGLLAVPLAGCFDFSFGNGSGGGGNSAPTGSLSGTVVDAINVTHPIGGAYVYVPATPSALGRQAAVRATYSDDNGNYALVSIPTGVHTLRVEPAAGSGYTATAARLEVVGGRDTQVRVTLLDEATAGLVADLAVSE